jgi:hypothetical protein
MDLEHGPLGDHDGVGLTHPLVSAIGAATLIKRWLNYRKRFVWIDPAR